MADLKFGSTSNNYLIWHKGNDGEGSSLDADIFDGREKESYLFTSSNSTISQTSTLSIFGSIDLSGASVFLNSFEIPIFSSLWKTDITGDGTFSSTNQIKFPLSPNGNYDFTIYWGDTTSSSITSWNQVELTHTYSQPGVYIITVQGIMDGFGFAQTDSDAAKLFDVMNWGDCAIHGDGYQFYNCRNLSAFSATNKFRSFGLQSVQSMFENAYRFNSPITISSEALSNSSNMFKNCYNFNSQLLINLDQVSNSSSMFENCHIFNQDLNCNLESSLNCSYMFQNCYSLDKQLNFSINENANLTSMFEGCSFSADNFSYIINNMTTSTSFPLNQFIGNIVSEFNLDAVDTIEFFESKGWSLNTLGQKVVYTDFTTDDLVLIINTGSNFRLPTIPTGTYNFTVHWGDGNSDTITLWDQLETTHTYSSPGKYAIKIVGTFNGFNFLQHPIEAPKLIDIYNFGNKSVVSAVGLYANCINLREFSATDSFSFVGVNSLEKMFYNCNYFDDEVNLAFAVGNVESIFENCKRFSGSSLQITTESLVELDPELMIPILVYGVENFSKMFKNCYSLVGDENTGLNLTIDNGKNFLETFKNCYAFKGEELQGSFFTLALDMNGIFEGCYNLDIGIYTNLLKNFGLGASGEVNSNIVFSAPETFYKITAEDARNSLIINKNWTIIDRGLFEYLNETELLEYSGGLISGIAGETSPDTGYVYTNDTQLLNDAETITDEIIGV